MQPTLTPRDGRITLWLRAGNLFLGIHPNPDWGLLFCDPFSRKFRRISQNSTALWMSVILFAYALFLRAMSVRFPVHLPIQPRCELASIIARCLLNLLNHVSIDRVTKPHTTRVFKLSMSCPWSSSRLASVSTTPRPLDRDFSRPVGREVKGVPYQSLISHWRLQGRALSEYLG